MRSFPPHDRTTMTTTIQYDDLVESIAAALQYISYYHPTDYIAHLARAYEREKSPAAKDAIAQILTNSKMSATGQRPICQDAGIVNVFLKVGMDVRWEGFTGSLDDAINEGVRRGYNHPDNTLRASVVADPQFARKNTKDNTPAVIFTEIVPGNTVDITVAAKGGGSENKSKMYMLNPGDNVVDWVLKTVPTMGAGWCPPGMLGIGIGGTAEKAVLMAKESLMDDLDMYELQAKAEAAKTGGPARGEQANCDDPQLRRHTPRALRDGWLGPGVPHAPEPGPVAQRELGARLQQEQEGQPRYADQGRSGQLEARRHPVAQRQDADGPRCRTQAHPGHAGQGREAARGLHQPRHLLRGPGGPREGRSRRPCRPYHRHTHGRLHRDDAGPDRPDRHGGQGRARPGRHRGHQEAPERLPHGRGRRRLPGLQGHQGRQGRGF